MLASTITDVVYEEIRERIASKPPELGGALYGPKDVPLVSHFEFDPEGATTAVSYVPSSRLISNVPRIERETGLEFKGVVHSHPLGIDRPSGGDEATAASFFRMNPHFSALELPIVQRDAPGQEFLRWYRVRRRGSGRQGVLWRQDSVDVVDVPFHVLPLRRHFNSLLSELDDAGVRLDASGGVQTLRIRNACLVGLVASAPDGRELIFCVSADYPIVGPVILFGHQFETQQLALGWHGLNDDPGDDLRAIAKQLSLEYRAFGAAGARATECAAEARPSGESPGAAPTMIGGSDAAD